MKNIGEYTFNPSKLRILHPVGTNGKRTRLNPEQMLERYPSYKAFMAAPMFNHTGSSTCGGGLTPCTRQWDLRSLIDFPSKRPRSGITFSIVRTTFGPTDKYEVLPRALDKITEDAYMGIQLYPTLVWQRTNKGKTEKPSSVAGLGLLSNGQFLSVVASSASLKDLGAYFLSKGCSYAGYTDAGSSAALYVVGEGYRGIHAKNPKLPAWLAVEA